MEVFGDFSFFPHYVGMVAVDGVMMVTDEQSLASPVFP
jgi:hypothetical protein